MHRHTPAPISAMFRWRVDSVAAWVAVACLLCVHAGAAVPTGARLAAALSNTSLQLPGWRADSANPCADPELGGLPWPGLVCDATGTRLLELRLAGAGLRGSLPPSWAALATLERVHLDNNELHGLLPAAWAALTALESLTASGNRLQGCVPPEYGGWARLHTLRLGGNALACVLADLPWARLAQLADLDLSHNRLNGSLPLAWSGLHHLLQLQVQGNQLSGTFPSTWLQPGGMQRLRLLNASGNALHGRLPAPAQPTQLPLQLLDVSHNRLSGSVPHALVRARQLSALDVRHNPQLCGALPLRASCLGALRVDTHGTQLAHSDGGGGQPRCAWQAQADALLRVKVALLGGGGEAASGGLASWLPGTEPCGVPPWEAVTCRGPDVVALRVALPSGSASAIGTLPDEVAGLAGSLRDLQVLGGPLAGTLPAAWSSLTRLTRLTVAGLPQVAAGLPPAWSTLAGLVHLNVSGCGVSGPLPAAWGRGAGLPNLTTLDVSDNRLEGELPAAWGGGLAALRSLSLHGNARLTGALPPAWSRLSHLSHLTLPPLVLAAALPSNWASLASGALDGATTGSAPAPAADANASTPAPPSPQGGAGRSTAGALAIIMDTTPDDGAPATRGCCLSAAVVRDAVRVSQQACGGAGAAGAGPDTACGGGVTRTLVALSAREPEPADRRLARWRGIVIGATTGSLATAAMFFLAWRVVKARAAATATPVPTHVVAAAPQQASAAKHAPAQLVVPPQPHAAAPPPLLTAPATAAASVPLARTLVMHRRSKAGGKQSPCPSPRAPALDWGGAGAVAVASSRSAVAHPRSRAAAGAAGAGANLRGPVALRDFKLLAAIAAAAPAHPAAADGGSTSPTATATPRDWLPMPAGRPLAALGGSPSSSSPAPLPPLSPRGWESSWQQAVAWSGSEAPSPRSHGASLPVRGAESADSDEDPAAAAAAGPLAGSVHVVAQSEGPGSRRARGDGGGGGGGMAELPLRMRLLTSRLRGSPTSPAAQEELTDTPPPPLPPATAGSPAAGLAVLTPGAPAAAMHPAEGDAHSDAAPSPAASAHAASHSSSTARGGVRLQRRSSCPPLM